MLNPVSIYIPLIPGEWAILRAVFPMREEQWNQMMRLLEVMRPGLVSDENGGNQSAPN